MFGLEPLLFGVLLAIGAARMPQPEVVGPPGTVPPAFVVRVGFDGPDGTSVASTTGIVTASGHVIVPFGAVEKARGARVMTPDGNSFDTEGIACYLAHEKIALIAVAWTHPPPAGAALIPGMPREDLRLTLVRARDMDGDIPATLVEAGLSPVKASPHALQIVPASPSATDRSFAGAPALVSDGRVAGLVTGVEIGVSVGLPGPAGSPVTPSVILTAAGSQTLAALIPGETISWDRWSTAVRADRARAKELLDGASESARKKPGAEIIPVLEEAIALDGYSEAAWNLLGWARGSTGELDRALEAFERACALAPTHGYPYCARAVVLANLGRTDEAVEMVERAVEFAPLDSSIQCRRGWVMLKAGKLSSAVEAFRESLGIDPNNEEARQYLDRLLESVRGAPGAKPVEPGPGGTP